MAPVFKAFIGAARRAWARRPAVAASDRCCQAVLHDLNNVLTGMAMTATLAEAALPLAHAARADLAALRHATAQAAALARQLHGPAPAPRLRPLDLAVLLRELEPLLRGLLGPQIAYRADVAPTLSFVAGDRAELERVFLNLAANARAAMPAGGRLLITAQPAVRAVRLTVSDTGAGMDAATRARAFEAGFTTRSGGSGLGLAICAEIVRRHGGTIALASDPGGGTTVAIELPSVHDNGLEYLHENG